jgi:hypothetical protein
MMEVIEVTLLSQSCNTLDIGVHPHRINEIVLEKSGVAK